MRRRLYPGLLLLSLLWCGLASAQQTAPPPAQSEDVKTQPPAQSEGVKTQPPAQSEGVKAQPPAQREGVKAQPAQSEGVKAQPPAQREGFKIVVNGANPEIEIDRDQVARYFLKKSRSWATSGEAVMPIDQMEKSTVRELFTEAVHGKKVSAIKSYWQRMIFSGRDVPPREAGSDQEVLDLVRSDKGAIGYVAATADLGTGVKAVKLVD